jgi:lipoprotein signal peptidase
LTYGWDDLVKRPLYQGVIAAGTAFLAGHMTKAVGVANPAALNSGIPAFPGFHVGSAHWPALNKADVFMVIGSRLLFITPLSGAKPQADP